MHHQHLDDLARHVFHARSRRAVLHRLAGGLAAGLLGLHSFGRPMADEADQDQIEESAGGNAGTFTADGGQISNSTDAAGQGRRRHRSGRRRGRQWQPRSDYYGAEAEADSGAADPSANDPRATGAGATGADGDPGATDSHVEPNAIAGASAAHAGATGDVRGGRLPIVPFVRPCPRRVCPVRGLLQRPIRWLLLSAANDSLLRAECVHALPRRTL